MMKNKRALKMDAISRNFILAGVLFKERCAGMKVAG